MYRSTRLALAATLLLALSSVMVTSADSNATVEVPDEGRVPRHANHHAENTARPKLPPSGSAPLGKRAGGVVLMPFYHKSGYALSHVLRKELNDHAALANLEHMPQMEWDCTSTAKHEIPSKLWGSRKTSVIPWHRPIVACDGDAPLDFGGELPRVALMYRDPFNQVISSYNYHMQVPTPEGWIRGYKKPFPTEHSASQAAQQGVADRLGIPNINLTRAAQLHGDLFTSAHAANYEEALRSLSAEDGLRMEAARFLCWTASFHHSIGGFGALLRMAANVVPVKRQFDSEIFLMEDWISPDDNVKEATMMRLLSLVCGDGECKDVATRSQVAAAFVRGENAKLAKGGNHITHTSHTHDEHAAQEAVLKADPVLGPLLSYFRCIISNGSVNAYDVCCFGASDGKC